MTTLSVGQLYHPTRTRWPETVQFSYRAGEHELVLFLDGPTDEEVESARVGVAEFALVVRGALIVLLYRFGEPGAGIPWSDAPYSIHLVAPGERSLPPLKLEVESRALLHVVLVDASTGIVRALRLLSWSPDFTARVHAAVYRQFKMSWNDKAYARELGALYTRYPTSEDLLGAANGRTIGGA